MEKMEGGHLMLMSKIMFMSIFFALLIGCKFNNRKTNVLDKKNEQVVLESLKTDTLLNEEKNIISEIKKNNISPDTTINKKLFLENNMSLSNFYSREKPLVLVERLRESSVIIFGNKSNKEYLLAYQYEGNTENTYSCFEIGYFEDDKKISFENSNQSDEINFQTESGLCLGLSLEEITRIKGSKYEQHKLENYRVLIYKIEDYKNSSFLKEYNMPSYFIEIWLENNIVKKIKFGFDYP